MNVAIHYYHPESYTTAMPGIMGLNAASESFLRGFLSHSKADAFWAHVRLPEHVQTLAALAKSLGRAEPVHGVTNQSLGHLAQAGTLYVPSSFIGQFACQRAAYGHRAWSLCGVTHTTSSARAMDALAELLTAPVQPWDAVICTSPAVKDNVQRLLAAQENYLRERLGITKLPLPQLPVIPLGIHTQDFVFADAQKAQARAALGADDNTFVVLFMGRLSFHSKAHPLAMYQALQQAAQSLPPAQKIVLVECGWHASEFIKNAFAEAADLACPDVRVVTLDGSKPEQRQIAWAGADVFCSLSDNIQETFGITPIEAMAAGIPVVVADWDGYRETVRDGVDGFRIASLMPGPGLGGDLALRHALEIDNYDMYCGLSCSLVMIDIEQTARAFRQLFASPELRRRLGASGRERARQVFDWAAIIPQYEALWTQLDSLRRQDANQATPHPWPARMDPFHVFGAYPTLTLTPATVFKLTVPDLAVTREDFARRSRLRMVSFAAPILPSEAECQAVLQALAQGPQAAGLLLRDIPRERQPYVFRGLAWLAKIGVIAPVFDDPSTNPSGADHD